MLSLKPGVRVGGLAPEMVLAGVVVMMVFREWGYNSCTITSCRDGQHKEGSLHYVGKALDFRTRDVVQSQLPTIVADIKEALGEEFDVVLEKDHIHLEFDPE